MRASLLLSLLLTSDISRSFALKNGNRAMTTMHRSYEAAKRRTLREAASGSIEPTDLFSNWAETGRDEIMAAGHNEAVTEMLKELEPHLPASSPYRVLDLGCGNGWVARRMISKDLCIYSIGVDGAAEMIKKAKAMEEKEGTGAEFTMANIIDFSPERPCDVVFSMEVLYYLREDEVKSLLRRLNTESEILSEGGLFVLGLDHFEENEDCHGWADLNNTRMLLWSEHKWKSELEAAGFDIVKAWRAAPGRPDIKSGTLAFICRSRS